MKNNRTILYARVSTEEQASDDHFSIDAQIREMNEYVDHNNLEVIGTFIDGGISGTKMERPQLQAALEVIKSGECDILLVHELSRLSRSIDHTLEIFKTLGEEDVGFASVKDPNFDFTKPGSRLFLTILAAMNQYYIDLLRLHTSKSKRERARRGLYNASVPPYGYEHTGTPQDPPVIIEEEAEAVKLIFERYSTGRNSYQQIADILSDRGYKTQNNRRFPKSAVGDILRNKFYMGKVVYHNRSTNKQEVYEGLHDPIVSQALWMRCKKIRDQRSTASRSIQEPYKGRYLLSGIVYCDVCGRRLRSHAGIYYREASHKRGYDDCPNRRKGTRTDLVDPFIHAIIQSIELPDDWLHVVEERLGKDKELESIRKKRDRLKSELRRVKRLYIQGEFGEDMDIYNKESSRIQRELDNIPTYDQLEGLRSTVEVMTNLHEIWDHAVKSDQHDLAQLIFRKIWVDVEEGRVVAVAPKAVMVPIFREVEFLEERELGYFVPRWAPPQAKKIVSFSSLDAVPELSERGFALPFAVDSPLKISPRKRIAPGVSHALKMIRGVGKEPEKIIQVVHPYRPEFKIGLRKWPDAYKVDMSPQEFSERKTKQIDALISQFLLWDEVVDGKSAKERVKTSYDQLSPGGVWYLVDLLPLSMPAHWLYRYFPVAWEWGKSKAWNLHDLYNAFGDQGFHVDMKRRVYYQPIALETAMAVVSRRPGLLGRLKDDVYQEGVRALQKDIEKKGKTYPLGSEFSLVEIWAQKIGVGNG